MYANTSVSAFYEQHCRKRSARRQKHGVQGQARLTLATLLKMPTELTRDASLKLYLHSPAREGDGRRHCNRPGRIAPVVVRHDHAAEEQCHDAGQPGQLGQGVRGVREDYQHCDLVAVDANEPPNGREATRRPHPSWYLMSVYLHMAQQHRPDTTPMPMEPSEMPTNSGSTCEHMGPWAQEHR